MVKKTFKVKGMHCKSCSILITDAVSEIDGVNNVKVSLADNTVTVDYDEKKVKDEMIKKAIVAEGYHVRG
ncbi:MAG: hypothetical protein KatS3mg002_0664 [Candidatus Woesearchaeota archaeon]|nr:MAG: hypothetical protein KatS3mg002_0664 [Candidatus Woesearchaeota archaeon]